MLPSPALSHAAALLNHARPTTPPAAVDAATTNGCTPLYIAANNGFAESVALLLELGADAELETTSGCTPLHAGGEGVCSRLEQAGWGCQCWPRLYPATASWNVSKAGAGFTLKLKDLVG